MSCLQRHSSTPQESGKELDKLLKSDTVATVAPSPVATGAVVLPCMIKSLRYLPSWASTTRARGYLSGALPTTGSEDTRQ